MIVDLAQQAPDRLQAEFAIIGAGAAGLTMARALVERGRTVLLLESGGADYEPASADLNRGETVGQPYYALHDSRLRFLGGTTAIWGGRCAELDPIDFEHRPWVPYSGWPFGKDELAPWYRQARARLELAAEDPALPSGLLPRLGEGDLRVRQWLIDTRFDRFGARRNADLLDDDRLTLVLHATVREILVGENGSAVTGLDVCAPDGRRLTATARNYVLAAGGLENPRLLLASNSRVPAGLGNQNDLVGRFFMEHPHGRGGRLTGSEGWSVIDAFRKRPFDGQETAALLAPSADLQRRSKILNSALTVAVRPSTQGRNSLITSAYMATKHRVEPSKRGRALWKGYKTVARHLRHASGPLYWWARERLRLAELVLVLRAEQAPRPDSRVSLIRDTDATGMPRLKLDWRMSPIDRASSAAVVDAFGGEAVRLGLGTVEPSAWLSDTSRNWVSDPLVSVHPLGGYHHMGTTRMADDPSRGVTDGWSRVHGIGNLYIAGSSLFPTSGWANPTLTILALALRTADRLTNLRA